MTRVDLFMPVVAVCCVEASAACIAQGNLEEVAKVQFHEFGASLGLDGQSRQSGRMEHYDAYMVVRNEQWIYSVDAFANQTFRPFSNVSSMGYRLSDSTAIEQYVLQPLLETAKRRAETPCRRR
jgi:hypothetical protein